MKSQPSKTKNVFVAMSGGVDSSVTAALLKKATPNNFKKLFGRPTPRGFRGYNVTGVHIKMWSDPTIPCNFKEDRYDAMRVAAKLDIPFITWDFTREYKKAVVEYMIKEYAAGRTPNPDVMCNREIKFGIFLKRALEAGADFVATGHYVRTQSEKRKTKNIQILQASDKNKDQSYFLWTLTQEQLKHCLFPIGEYTKPEVRTMAKKLGLPTAEKPDSQGICFVGEIDVMDFLKRHIPETPGRVLTTGGRAVGEHQGLQFYTIGQRHGLGIGGTLSVPKSHIKRDGGIPYYVAKKDFKTNTLVVAEGPYDEKLFSPGLKVSKVNWIAGPPAGGKPKFPLRCEARIRYRQPLQFCRVTEDNKKLKVVFDEPQRAVTPGQSVVFYKGEEMLGGGVIV